MKIHEIKLNEEFCDSVFCGEKNFEIRKNDRGYQKGDIIKFIPVSNIGIIFFHPIRDTSYEITYVLSGWGIKEEYVVFGIKECESE